MLRCGVEALMTPRHRGDRVHEVGGPVVAAVVGDDRMRWPVVDAVSDEESPCPAEELVILGALQLRVLRSGG